VLGDVLRSFVRAEEVGDVGVRGLVRRPAAGTIVRTTAAVGATPSPMDIEPLFRDHVRENLAEIWDIPISGEVLSTPFEREWRERRQERNRASKSDT